MIDFTKPLELEDGTPVKVTGKTYYLTHGGIGHQVEYFTNGERHDAYYTDDGTATYLKTLPRIRNKATIDWSKPIELDNGVPAKLVKGPDADGDYEVRAKWGVPGECNLYVNASGEVLGIPRLPKVRNKPLVTVELTTTQYEALKALGVL